MKKCFIVISSLLTLTISSSMAMSLGRHSGATLVGRPLDITVQAALEAQDDVNGRCLEAEVFYGDTKLASSRISVTLERLAATPAQAVIRIRSPIPVDEPIVTFFLRAGCQLKTERRYVVLAELASEVAIDRNPPVPMPPVSPARAAATTGSNAAGVDGQAPGPNGAGTARPGRSRAAADSVSSAKPQASPSPAQGGGLAKAAQARLKLEPVDLTVERDPRLKSSTELLSRPAVDLRERAAASALWRALSAQPEDILRDSEKLKTLESSVLGLQTQNKKGLLSIDELNAKVKQAEEERYANVLVYALIALLLVALLVLAYLLRRRAPGSASQSGDKPWWRKNDAYESQQQAWSNSLQATQLDGLGVDRQELHSKLSPAAVGVDVDLDLDRPNSGRGADLPLASSMFFEPDASASKFPLGFEVSAHPSRTAKAEELFDVQQQADFFVSIGQHDQAIEVLLSHIAENPDTSALVHLDLFNLYHSFKLSVEYDRLRETFNRRFNAQVPPFELYAEDSIGLESYPLALSRIEALWPTVKVLDIIEESLFRRPDPQAEAFNLEAYRELLLLYSVAKEVINPKSDSAVVNVMSDLPDRDFGGFDPTPIKFKATSIQPLSAVRELTEKIGNNLTPEHSAAALLPPFSPSLGLDIDLGELSSNVNGREFPGISDAEFFAKPDLDATPMSSHVDSAPTGEPNRLVADADGVIDFELFEMPEFAPVKPKLPPT